MVNIDAEHGTLDLRLQLAEPDDVDERADVAPTFAVVYEWLG